MSGFICVDANIAAKWIFREENTPLALRLYNDSIANQIDVIEPPHFTVEVVNVIRRRVARAMITAAEGENYLRQFLRFTVSVASPPGIYEQALRRAQELNHPSAYDAHYIALAHIAGCDFWTADKRLLNALDGRLPFVRDLANYR